MLQAARRAYRGGAKEDRISDPRQLIGARDAVTDRATVVRLAREAAARLTASRPPPDPFGEVYAPSLIRFCLSHWPELLTLASGDTEPVTTRVGEGRRARSVPVGRGWISLDGVEWAGGPSHNADLADYLRREYAELRYRWHDIGPRRLTPDERARYCLCTRQALFEAAPHERSGAFGEAGGRSRRVVADIEHAAEGLCPVWPSGSQVYERMGTGAAWEKRRAAIADPPAWIRVMGADPGYGGALRWMARDLGWSALTEVVEEMPPNIDIPRA